MRDKSLLSPFYKTIDRLLFGIKESNDQETKADFIEIDNEEEFDVERSIN